MMPAPPDFVVDEYALAAWRNTYAATIARVPWDDVFNTLLLSVSVAAASYCRKALASQDPLAPEIVEWRTGVRQLMAEFLLIPQNRIPVAEIRPDGLDREIAALCGIE